MRTNPIYKSLLSKSMNSMLSAIEIYNKPNFSYREEAFAILAVNAIELLLKAQLLKLSNYNIKRLYVLEATKTKSGTPHKKNKKPKLSRSRNPQTIGLFETLKKLDELGYSITKNHNSNIESLVELRDNAIHFHNENYILKEIQEIGFATIKNYLHLIKKWKIEIDLSTYNLYLMPLAYVDSKVMSSGVITDEVQNYLNFVKSKIDDSEEQDTDFDIAISIDINFNKSNSFDGIGFKYDESGVPVTLTEENIKQKYPLTYSDVCTKAKTRYTNFKQNSDFNIVMRGIKDNDKLTHHRSLDPDKPSAAKKCFYSSNIWKELDKHYSK
ncbi:DUF3644 domain-containing protein [Elizabethkingia ursingii]|uniref:DUF3644 domain-containing protein n=1 Tax=Elizabethkingia ursingii TaxID=1756150 RepID=UPI0020130427|nr:DUF3644 domain-containing protein [Elizabethkingia ursingii]MCL1663324.1 DUF3644 domain-containing protein [Elizabethkingia ursingii]